MEWRVERCLEADRQDEKKRLEKEGRKEEAKQIPASDQGGISLYAYRSDQFKHDPIWMGPVKVEVGAILEESWWWKIHGWTKDLSVRSHSFALLIRSLQVLATDNSTNTLS